MGPKVHEPAEGVEQFHRDFADRHGRDCPRRVGHLNLLPAEKFPDDGHLELERQGETRRLLTRFYDPG